MRPKGSAARRRAADLRESLRVPSCVDAYGLRQIQQGRGKCRAPRARPSDRRAAGRLTPNANFFQTSRRTNRGGGKKVYGCPEKFVRCRQVSGCGRDPEPADFKGASAPEKRGALEI